MTFEKLDSFDTKIIKILQNDSRITQTEIAQMVNLSTSAVNRRITELEKSGVIERYIAVVDNQRIGYPVTVITMIRLNNERIDLLDEMRNTLIACPQVSQVYYVTGDIDLFVVINVKDMAEYEALTRELFFSSENVKRFQTHVVMSTAKRTLSAGL